MSENQQDQQDQQAKQDKIISEQEGDDISVTQLPEDYEDTLSQVIRESVQSYIQESYGKTRTSLALESIKECDEVPEEITNEQLAIAVNTYKKAGKPNKQSFSEYLKEFTS